MALFKRKKTAVESANVQSVNPEVQVGNLEERVKLLLKKNQFWWFVGHVITLTYGVKCIVSTILRRNFVPSSYYAAYFGTLLSYGIVVYLVHAPPKFSVEWIKQLSLDDNVQYFILALTWINSSPITFSLFPYVIFSAFHVMAFARSSIFPTLVPNPKPDSTLQKASAIFGKLTTTYQHKALSVAAQYEVLVLFPMIIFSALFGLTGLLQVLVFVHFLRYKYMISERTGMAFSSLNAFLDKWLVANQSCPIIVRQMYVAVRDAVYHYLSLAPTAASIAEQSS